MKFTGIETLVFSCPDMKTARRFYGDWGLKKVSDSRAGLVFETAVGDVQGAAGGGGTGDEFPRDDLGRGHQARPGRRPQ